MRTEGFKGILLSALMITSIIALAIPLLSPSPVHATLTSHAPIYINGNGGFTKPDPVNGGGSGTMADPYIIENWDINASGADGIDIRNTTAYFIIRNCYIHDGGWNYTGINFGNVTNGKIENDILKDIRFGITLDYSDNIIISNNIMENNEHGINLFFSNNNIISNNIMENNYRGLYIVGSSNNTISYNNVKNNFYYGFLLSSFSNYNIISNNNVQNNNYGIYLYESMGNLIYHNNFINNVNQAWSNYTNLFDNGYPSGGNYWSDYTGGDADNDGIGDIPYPIPGGTNQDRYPRMNPWSPPPPPPPPPPAPVGGIAFSPDKLALLAPYIILAALIAIAVVSAAVYRRRLSTQGG